MVIPRKNRPGCWPWAMDRPKPNSSMGFPKTIRTNRWQNYWTARTWQSSRNSWWPTPFRSMRCTSCWFRRDISLRRSTSKKWRRYGRVINGAGTLNLHWPILELTRLTFRSGHRLKVWYHRFSETPFTVDELETSHVIDISLFYRYPLLICRHQKKSDDWIEVRISQHLTTVTGSSYSQYIMTNRIHVIFYFFRGNHHPAEISTDHNITCPNLFLNLSGYGKLVQVRKASNFSLIRHISSIFKNLMFHLNIKN